MASLLQTNPWRFAGGYFDSATGFTKFGVRYYDATTGRWTQQDPKAGSLFDPRSSNRYVYAKCDPVNDVDPNGAMDCLEVSAILFFSILVLVGAILTIPEAALASVPALIGAILAGGPTAGAIIGAIGAFGLGVITAIDVGRCFGGG